MAEHKASYPYYPKDIFGNSLLPSTDQIESQLTDGLLKEWASENLRKTTILVSAAIARGKVDDSQKALDYWNQFARNLNPAETILSAGDVNATTTTARYWRELDTKLSPKAPKDHVALSYRTYGTISHAAIGRLLAGELPTFHHQITSPQNPFDVQLNLFANSISSGSEYSDAILPNHQINPRHLHRIEDLLKVLTAKLNQSKDHFSQRSSTVLERAELVALLLPIFNGYIHKLPGSIYDDPNMLTLMSWAQTLFHLHDVGPKPSFREVQISDPSLGLLAGRADCLEVTKIGNKPPTAAQNALITQVSKSRFKNVPQMQAALESVFDQSVSMRVVDWKFAIGDSLNSNSIITPDQIQSPLSKHLRQVQRYLTIASLGSQLHDQGHFEDSFWPDQDPFETGQLFYVLPDGNVFHSIDLDQSDKMAILSGLAKSWTDILKRRQKRHIEKKLASHALSFWRNQPIIQLKMILGREPQSPIERILELVKA